MQRTGRTLVIAAVAGGVLATAQAQPVFDNMKCYNVKDSLGSGEYTADLQPQDATTFALEPGDTVVGGVLRRGCRIKMAARYFCIPVTDLNNRSTRPPFDPAQWTVDGAEPGDRLCYKLRCPSTTAKSLDVIDQFGSRRISVTGKTAYLCTPVTRALNPGQPCGLAGNGQCGGVCEIAGEKCLAISGEDCGCVPASQECAQTVPGMCSVGFCTGVWENCGMQVTGVCGCNHP